MARTRLPVVLSALTVALTVLLMALLPVLLRRWIPLRAILSLLLPIALLITVTLLLPLAKVVITRSLVVRLHAVTLDISINVTGGTALSHKA